MLRKMGCRVQTGHGPITSLKNHLGGAIMDHNNWLWGLCLASSSVSGWEETHSHSEHQILNTSLLIFCLDRDAWCFHWDPFRQGISRGACLACVLSRKGFYVVEQSGQSYQYVLLIYTFKVPFDQAVLLSSMYMWGSVGQLRWKAWIDWSLSVWRVRISKPVVS